MTHKIIGGHPNVSTLSSEVSPAPLFTVGAAAFTYGHGCTDKERAKSFPALFDAIAGLNADASTQAMGVKAALHTAGDAQTIAKCVGEHHKDLRIILVVRDNLLEQYASVRRARATGVWHTDSGRSANASEGVIRVDRELFHEYVRESRELIRVLRGLSTSNALLELSYEREIAVGGFVAFNRVFDFLGVPAIPVTWSGLEKVTPPLDQFVVNIDEARQWYAAMDGAQPSPAAPAIGSPIAWVRRAQNRARLAIGKARRIARIVRE